jgi:Vitamin K-dependent gamma-carboxylase
VSRATKAWERFFFEPQPTSTLALVRIAVGLLSLGWGLSLLPDLFDFFSSDAVVPEQPAGQEAGVWGLLEIFPSDAALVTVYVALLVGSVALTLGLFARVAALVVFLALLAFARRGGIVFNSGDGLVRNLALFMVLAPAGASLSLDRLRHAKERFWEFPARAPWALRLIQIQVSVLYVSTVWQKARGVDWNEGTAVSYALRIEDLERFPMPSALTGSLPLSNVLTLGTLAVELSLGILVWNRVLRPYVLSLGVGMHLAIGYSIRVGFFTSGVLAAYLAFVSPETARKAILAVRDRLAKSPLVRSRATADHVPETAAQTG